MPLLTCSSASTFADVSVISSNGFKGIYHKNLQGFSGDNYVLMPGNSGNITLAIRATQEFSSSNYLSQANITSNEVFIHETKSPEEKFTHLGLMVSYEPKILISKLNSSVTTTLVIYASPDAPLGTYWLFLPPGGCGGGPLILFTVGNQQY